MKSGTGVVVGRFQVPALHDGHLHLLRTVAERHARLVVVLGCTGKQADPKNPLDFWTRELMIKALYPFASVFPIIDHPSDEVWSETLDHMVGKTAILYGSRDSFIKQYKGKCGVEELEPVTVVTGTKLRSEVLKQPLPSFDFRCGVIYAQSKDKS